MIILWGYFKEEIGHMISITELAEHIVLDEVTDTFYRTMCFSNFSRSIHEPKNKLEQKLDEVISHKLSRQLNWSSSVCSLENATHKMTHLISLFLQKKLTESQLNKLIEENYWLAAAISKELPDGDISCLLLENAEEPKINSSFSAMVYRYFMSQLNAPYRYLAEQTQLFSQVVTEIAAEQCSDKKQEAELHHLTFLNAYPYIVLLMLLDKTVQSAKQELLNQIGFECEQSRELVRNYQPCAEQVLSFLIFDEFVKYHIHDNLYGDVQTNLGIESEQSLEESQRIFLQARTKAILNSLAHIPVLTAEQKASFSAQLGIKAEIKQEVSESFASLLKRLMPGKYAYNISFPV